jgi:hypothetical protein
VSFNLYSLVSSSFNYFIVLLLIVISSSHSLFCLLYVAFYTFFSFALFLTLLHHASPALNSLSLVYYRAPAYVTFLFPITITLFSLSAYCLLPYRSLPSLSLYFFNPLCNATLALFHTFLKLCLQSPISELPSLFLLPPYCLFLPYFYFLFPQRSELPSLFLYAPCMSLSHAISSLCVAHYVTASCSLSPLRSYGILVHATSSYLHLSEYGS